MGGTIARVCTVMKITAHFLWRICSKSVHSVPCESEMHKAEHDSGYILLHFYSQKQGRKIILILTLSF